MQSGLNVDTQCLMRGTIASLFERKMSCIEGGANFDPNLAKCL